jgi:hypothetical protein
VILVKFFMKRDTWEEREGVESEEEERRQTER